MGLLEYGHEDFKLIRQKRNFLCIMIFSCVTHSFTAIQVLSISLFRMGTLPELPATFLPTRLLARSMPPADLSLPRSLMRMSILMLYSRWGNHVIIRRGRCWKASRSGVNASPV